MLKTASLKQRYNKGHNQMCLFWATEPSLKIPCDFTPSLTMFFQTKLLQIIDKMDKKWYHIIRLQGGNAMSRSFNSLRELKKARLVPKKGSALTFVFKKSKTHIDSSTKKKMKEITILKDNQPAYDVKFNKIVERGYVNDGFGNCIAYAEDNKGIAVFDALKGVCSPLFKKIIGVHTAIDFDGNLANVSSDCEMIYNNLKYVNNVGNYIIGKKPNGKYVVYDFNYDPECPEFDSLEEAMDIAYGRKNFIEANINSLNSYSYYNNSPSKTEHNNSKFATGAALGSIDPVLGAVLMGESAAENENK